MIINNKDFVNDVFSTRTGSEKDLKDLVSLFSNVLRFTVTERSNLSYPEMSKEIMAFAGKEEQGEADMAAVVVMSHGKEGTIYSSDGRWLETDWILKQFNNCWCPSLRGKPKLFIFQSCRGEEKDCGVSATATDSQGMSRGLEMRDVSWEDMVIAYSTIRGYVAHRDTVDGSWFVQALCEVFRGKADTSEIREMLDTVAKRLSKYQSERGTKQSFDYVIRHLYKKFFFFPERISAGSIRSGAEAGSRVDQAVLGMLESLRLVEYEEVFKEQDLSLADIAELDHEALKSIGISLVKHRTAIIKYTSGK